MHSSVSFSNCLKLREIFWTYVLSNNKEWYMNCVYYYISSHQDNVRIINMWYGFYVWEEFFVTWMWDKGNNNKCCNPEADMTLL